MEKKINSDALARLKACRPRLTWKQYSVLQGQILAGDDKAAMKGLDKILKRQGYEVITL